MAIAKGTEVRETVIKHYWGVATCKVLAVNPTQEKLNEIMGYERKLLPYVEKKEDGTVRARIDFVVATDPEVHGGVEEKAILSYYINKAQNIGSASGSIQVIDEYGRTAWGQPDVVKAKKQIVYARKDGSGDFEANVTTNYRPALVGEEDLTNFLSVFLNIPNVQKWDNKAKTYTKELIEHPENAECRLDRIVKIFDGDFKEISSAISCQPANKVKLLWGLRKVEKDGQTRFYPAIYNRMVLRAKTTDYSKLEADINERKSNGQYSDTEFRVCEFQEYTVEPTNLDEVPTSSGAGSEDFNTSTGWGF